MELPKEVTGILTEEEFKKQLPPLERILKGPVAFTECIQEIPCNPCVDACRFDAIHMENISKPPKVDFDKCTGCTLCVSRCPGLAFFMIDGSKSDTHWRITIPYEFLPMPKIGDVVEVIDRKGEVRGKGKVVRAIKLKDATGVVTLEVPKEYAVEIRHFRRIEE